MEGYCKLKCVHLLTRRITFCVESCCDGNGEEPQQSVADGDNNSSKSSTTKNNDNSTTKNNDNSTTKNNDNSTTKNNDNSTTKNNDNSTTKNNDSSTTKNNDNSTTKNNDNSTTKNNDNSTTKNNDNSTTKNNDSSTTKNNDNSTTKNNDNSTTNSNLKFDKIPAAPTSLATPTSGTARSSTNTKQPRSASTSLAATTSGTESSSDNSKQPRAASTSLAATTSGTESSSDNSKQPRAAITGLAATTSGTESSSGNSKQPRVATTSLAALTSGTSSNSKQPRTATSRPQQIARDSDQMLTLVNYLFDNKPGTHSLYHCVQSQLPCNFIKKKGRKQFDHKWISNRELTFDEETGIWWLVYVPDEGMYSILCRFHQTHNTKKQTEIIWTGTCSPNAKRFLARACQIHETQECSGSRNDITGLCLPNEAIRTKELQCRNPLWRFHSFERLEHFQHQSNWSARGMVLIMAQFIKNNFLEEARRANAYGLMVDDVTDISVKEQNILFLQFYSVASGMVEIKFLNVADLLECESRANADCITSCITDELA